MFARMLLLIIFICSTLYTSFAFAELSFAKIFSDHMVLQREQAARIWGWAEPNTKVELCLINHCYDTSSNNEGVWELRIGAQAASGPHELHLKSGSQTLTLNDVYFGDVWLAGGQSNMEWTLKQGVDNQDAELADSNYPLIRSFKVLPSFSPKEQEQLSSGRWIVASPTTVADFSAVAWFFAKKLHLQKNVAVGIVSSNWGGTPAEAWLSREALMNLPAYKNRTQDSDNDLENYDARVALSEKNSAEKYRRLFSRTDAEATGAHKIDFNDKHWGKVDFPSEKMFTDVTWYRKTFELKSVPQDGVVIDLGDLMQVALIYVNEKLIKVEDWNSFGSRHQIPASLLRQGKNQISIRLTNSWFNQVILGREGNMFLASDNKKIDLNKGWRVSSSMEPPLPVIEVFNSRPSFLYNAMIHPIRKMSFRGVLWYQGESNVSEAPLYGDLFKALIQDWRLRFDVGIHSDELPFLFVQIAGFGGYADDLAGELRFQQAQALTLPNTAMATAVDLGDVWDIHPRNKQAVSERLWLNAKNLVFYDKVINQAPAVKSYEIKGSSLVLDFEVEQGQLISNSKDGQIPEFELADRKGRYHLALAKLEGNRLTVTSANVKKPTAIRYLWKSMPDVQLYSELGFPVLPFKLELKN